MKMKPGSYCLLLGAALLGGCATQATHVESQGNQTLVSVNKINMQDWYNAADQMIASLLGSGKIQTNGDQPAIMAISRIVNDTTQQIDIDMLTKKMRIALNQSGKINTTTVYGLNGAEDPLAKAAAEKNAFIENKKITKKFDYTLSGKIHEDRVSVGRLHEASYIFQLSLTDGNGIAVWEEEVPITKQGKGKAVGW